MATRIKEGMIPYKGGVGIEITNNHIINVLLREANNLIHVNDNNELYVDLQLDEGIKPDDDFPVGVTTGRILQEDGRQQSGLILNWKTTSGDYARLIYANDGSLYVDLGDGVWIEILGAGGVKVKWGDIGGYLRHQTDLAQALDEKVNLGDNDIYDGTIVRLKDCIETPGGLIGSGKWVELNPNGTVLIHEPTTAGYKEAILNNGSLELLSNTALGGDKTATIDHEKIVADDGVNNKIYYFLGEHRIATLDDIQPGTRITIDKNPSTGVLTINADVSGVMTYKGNVTDQSQLPTTGQQVGDCWYSEADHTMFAWDGTQWNDIGGTGIDLTNYFNLNVNTSDDITEGSIHLFCTAIEKNYWNNKQDKLIEGENIYFSGTNNTVINAVDTKYTGGNGISINGTVIDNDSPFAPENAGAMGQILQKTSDGYKWINPNFVISVNNQTGAVTVDEFTPANQGTAGQVLKKTQNGYEWQNETAGQYTGDTGIQVNQASKTIKNTLPFNPTNTGRAGQVIKLNSDGVTYSWQNDESGGGGGGGGGGGNFNPDNTGQPGQVLTKKTNGRYDWEDIELPSGENNVKFWTIHSHNPSTQQMQEITDWVELDANNGAILNDLDTKDVFVFYNLTTEGLSKIATFHGTKRISERVWRQTHANGQFTKAYEQALTIDYTKSSQRYSMWVGENPDSSTHTNYISALGANYEGAYIPQIPSEPATKAYVDQAVAAGPSHVGGIVSNTTGTTSRVSSIWAGTTAELNNISQRDPTCLYFSFSS